MNHKFCTLSTISEQVYAISNHLTKQNLLITSTADKNDQLLCQYFPYINYSPVELTHTYMLGLIMSNPDENIYYSCKELFPMEFLIEVSKEAVLMDSLMVYMNMCSCIIPSFFVSTVDNMQYEVCVLYVKCLNLMFVRISLYIIMTMYIYIHLVATRRIRVEPFY